MPCPTCRFLKIIAIGIHHIVFLAELNFGHKGILCTIILPLNIYLLEILPNSRHCGTQFYVCNVEFNLVTDEGTERNNYHIRICVKTEDSKRFAFT
jgi:hypothetical protein